MKLLKQVIAQLKEYLEPGVTSEEPTRFTIINAPLPLAEAVFGPGELAMDPKRRKYLQKYVNNFTGDLQSRLISCLIATAQNGTIHYPEWEYLEFENLKINKIEDEEDPAYATVYFTIDVLGPRKAIKTFVDFHGWDTAGL